MPRQQWRHRAVEGEFGERIQGTEQTIGGIDWSSSQSEPSTAPCPPFSLSGLRFFSKRNPKSYCRRRKLERAGNKNRKADLRRKGNLPDQRKEGGQFEDSRLPWHSKTSPAGKRTPLVLHFSSQQRPSKREIYITTPIFSNTRPLHPKVRMVLLKWPPVVPSLSEQSSCHGAHFRNLV